MSDCDDPLDFVLFAAIAIYRYAAVAHRNASSDVLMLRNLISKLDSGNVELFIFV